MRESGVRMVRNLKRCHFNNSDPLQMYVSTMHALVCPIFYFCSVVYQPPFSLSLSLLTREQEMKLERLQRRTLSIILIFNEAEKENAVFLKERREKLVDPFALKAYYMQPRFRESWFTHKKPN